MLKSEKVPLEETLIVSLGLLAGRERKVEVLVSVISHPLLTLTSVSVLSLVDKHCSGQSVSLPGLCYCMFMHFLLSIY